MLDDPRFTDDPVTLEELTRLQIEVSLLSPLRDVGCAAASCHPLQTFPDAESSQEAFQGVTFGVEGDAPAVQTAAEAHPRTIRVQIITPPSALTRSGQTSSGLPMLWRFS